MQPVFLLQNGQTNSRTTAPRRTRIIINTKMVQPEYNWLLIYDRYSPGQTS